MGLNDALHKIFNIPTVKDIEELKNTVATQELLIKGIDDIGSGKTFASSMAREERLPEDIQGTVLKRVPIKKLQLLYLNNQFIFRGVNVRADEAITRGYELRGGDEPGKTCCEELIKNSGGQNLFWQLSVNTDITGNGYLEKITNKAKTKILELRHVNPVNFGFWTDNDDNDKIIVGPDGTPEAYMQIVLDNNNAEQRIKIPKKNIAHLKFNTFADEFSGISSLQPVYNTSIRLMNMEHAAAEAAVKTANPTWVVETETKSAQDLARWASVLGRISAQEVVFLPNGVKIDLKSPGPQNFTPYSDYFLDAVVAALGVPKSILTGSGGSDGGNRATTQVLSKHFYSVIRANQRYIEILFNEIFREYGEMAGFEPPTLIFNDIAEDADRNGQRAGELFAAGLLTLGEAREMIGLETTKETEEKLKLQLSVRAVPNIDPRKEEKKADMETWHGDEPGSPSGSQKGNKKKQKIDTDIKSVR